MHVERSAGGILWLRYHVEGSLDLLTLPDPADPVRADGLWKTTCFELFVRSTNGAVYGEFNFSPSSQWAAYRFDHYREGMSEVALSEVPEIGLDASETHFALETDLKLPAPWIDVGLGIALSAVIEETDGTKSYWALRHPPGKPDFHHPDCFALTLPAPDLA